MYYAYFTGGSQDLTKRAMQGLGPERRLFFYAPAMCLSARPTDPIPSEDELPRSPPKERYNLIGQCRAPYQHSTYIYEFAGIEK
jgi:hypothetical protein